jgi:hypothetical protein
MAIITAQSKVPAQIGAFGRAKESTFNPGQMIQSIKAISNDGRVEHWFTLPAEQAKAFNMGQPLNLIPVERKGKPTYDIEPLDLPAAPQMPNPQPQRPLGFCASPEQSYAAPVSFQQPAPMQQQQSAPGPDKAAIAAWITGQAKLYSYCYSQAAAALPDGVPPEAVQGCASTLFISASRKFNLER